MTFLYTHTKSLSRTAEGSPKPIRNLQSSICNLQSAIFNLQFSNLPIPALSLSKCAIKNIKTPSTMKNIYSSQINKSQIEFLESQH